MTLTLRLTADLEQRLREEAQRLGIDPDECALRLLAERLAVQARRAEVVATLQSWLEEDDQEARETGAYLVQALDEDRPSSRKLFPPEMKGVTW
jgi:hypothetical protein